MVSVVDRWSPAGFAARLVVLGATGIAWTAISLQSVLLHPDYWDPVTLSDWLAIWGYTATWLLTAGSLIVLREVAAPDEALRAAIAIVVVTSAMTGLANGLEDGLGVGSLGTVYVVGILASVVGMVIVAAMTWSGRTRRLAFVPLLGGLAAFSMVLGGGFLALIAWPGFGGLLWRARRQAGRLSSAEQPAS